MELFGGSNRQKEINRNEVLTNMSYTKSDLYYEPIIVSHTSNCLISIAEFIRYNPSFITQLFLKNSTKTACKTYNDIYEPLGEKINFIKDNFENT